MVEAYDVAEGNKYFRCWRNRQAVFPVNEEDGTLKPNPRWPDISDGLHTPKTPLQSCHSYRCRLPLLPVSTKLGEVLVGSMPEALSRLTCC